MAANLGRGRPAVDALRGTAIAVAPGMRTTLRLLQTVGMLMIGDGLMAAVEPRGHARLWQAGPGPWRRTMRRLARQPERTRRIGAAEIAIGLGVAWLLAHREG